VAEDDSVALVNFADRSGVSRERARLPKEDVTVGLAGALEPLVRAALRETSFEPMEMPSICGLADSPDSPTRHGYGSLCEMIKY
jgi:hypothetical protein